MPHYPTRKGTGRINRPGLAVRPTPPHTSTNTTPEMAKQVCGTLTLAEAAGEAALGGNLSLGGDQPAHPPPFHCSHASVQGAISCAEARRTGLTALAAFLGLHGSLRFMSVRSFANAPPCHPPVPQAGLARDHAQGQLPQPFKLAFARVARATTAGFHDTTAGSVYMCYSATPRSSARSPWPNPTVPGD